MRILVCGGRDYSERIALFAALERLHKARGIDTVIHGACTGADFLAGEWAEGEDGIAVEPYPVDHTVDGPWPAAGPKRNRRMLAAGRPDGVVAFPGGRGTADMCRAAEAAGVKVWRPYR